MARVTLISPETKEAVGKLRVCAYCRVSTNSADQLNSYAKQIKTYTELIKRNSKWELVEIFADEGISGVKTENRAEFQRMMRMCELKQIDLIITKSVSRFARNVRDALQYVRKLKLLGVGVQFEKEGIYTLSLGDEMLLNTFTAIAEEESKAISQNCRLSIVKRMEKGEFVDSHAPYGFKLVNKKLEIYEPEAEIIKRIFQLYLLGWSAKEIAREMNSKRIATKEGAKEWTSKQIRYMLTNERYVGDCFYQKTYSEKSVPFKQHRNYGEEDRFYAKDTHEGIIDRKTFDQVQTLIGKKKEQFGKGEMPQCKYPLTERIKCEVCGSGFIRKKVGSTTKWVCSKHVEDKNLCISNYYVEERIYDGFIAMVNKLRFGSERILDRIILKLEAANRKYKQNNIRATGISQSIAEINAKLLMLEQLRSKGYLAPEAYQSQTKELNIELSNLKNAREIEFKSELLSMLDELHKLKGIIEEIEEPLQEFDEKLFYEIVTDMSINSQDEMTMTIIGGLKFKEII